jgi:TRAP-type C4-dicarboxylate transport system permease small subunit
VETVKKLGKTLHRVYAGIGMAAMGVLAALVIFTVIARYFFSLSWKELDEFITVLFAFTTFWGLGLAVLEEEHVTIDIVFRLFKPWVKRAMGILNLLIALAVAVIACVYSFTYIGKIGGHLSPGMMIPMKFIYGIMPVCFILCAVCIVVRIILLIAGRAGGEPDASLKPAEGRG